MKKILLVALALIFSGCTMMGNPSGGNQIAGLSDTKSSNAKYKDVISVKKDTDHLLVMPIDIELPKENYSAEPSEIMEYERSICGTASTLLMQALSKQGFSTTTFKVRAEGLRALTEGMSEGQIKRDDCLLRSSKAKRIKATYAVASQWTNPAFSRPKGISDLQSLFMVTINEHADLKAPGLQKYCRSDSGYVAGSKCFVAFPYLLIEGRTVKFSLIIINMSSSQGDLVSHVYDDTLALDSYFPNTTLELYHRAISRLIPKTINRKK
jgi:hypothetical protein